MQNMLNLSKASWIKGVIVCSIVCPAITSCTTTFMLLPKFISYEKSIENAKLANYDQPAFAMQLRRNGQNYCNGISNIVLSRHLKNNDDGTPEFVPVYRLAPRYSPKDHQQESISNIPTVFNLESGHYHITTMDCGNAYTKDIQDIASFDVAPNGITYVGELNLNTITSSKNNITFEITALDHSNDVKSFLRSQGIETSFTTDIMVVDGK